MGYKIYDKKKKKYPFTDDAQYRTKKSAIQDIIKTISVAFDEGDYNKAIYFLDNFVVKEVKNTVAPKTKKSEKNVYTQNGRKFYIDENKVKTKNGRKYFFLKKTFVNDHSQYGRLKKRFLYIPIKKQGREQWEVYILDDKDPYYKIGR